MFPCTLLSARVDVENQSTHLKFQNEDFDQCVCFYWLSYMKYTSVMIRSSRLHKMFMNFYQIIWTVNILLPHLEKKLPSMVQFGSDWTAGKTLWWRSSDIFVQSSAFFQPELLELLLWKQEACHADKMWDTYKTNEINRTNILIVKCSVSNSVFFFILLESCQHFWIPIIWTQPEECMSCVCSVNQRAVTAVTRLAGLMVWNRYRSGVLIKDCGH